MNPTRASDSNDRPCSGGDCRHAHAPRRAAPAGDTTKRCEHFDDIRKVAPQTDGCAGCLAEGKSWTELRVCLTCGYVGCCEDSSGRHAERHWQETGHPMIVSYERLETWGWCYPHHRYFDPMPMPLPQRPYVWQSWLQRWFGVKPPAVRPAIDRETT